MDDLHDGDAGSPKPKRTDVGYKRPPPEHQFKKGQKPKPRKKAAQEPPTSGSLLWRILREERRVVIDGKAQYRSNAELLLRKAFELADKGNPAMSQLLAEMLLAKELAELQRPSETKLVMDGVDWGLIQM